MAFIALIHPQRKERKLIERGMQVTDDQKEEAVRSGLADSPGTQDLSGHTVSGDEVSGNRAPADKPVGNGTSGSPGSGNTEGRNSSADRAGAIRILPAGSVTETESAAPDSGPVTSVMHKGVTVSVEQTLTDNYRAVISLKVHGLDFPEDAEPWADCEAEIDGADTNWSGGFYDGTIAGPDGKAWHDDGTPINWKDDAEAASALRYTDENGDLEYQISFENSGAPGALIGKEIAVSLSNLGWIPAGRTGAAADGTVSLRKEIWALHWTLQGTREGLTAKPDAEIGNTGATVTKAELSPISMRLTMNWPFEPVTESGFDEDGSPITVDSYKEPPKPYGFRMKDGTYELFVLNESGEGYYGDDEQTYTLQYRLDRIIDPGRVDALLFMTDELSRRISATDDLSDFDFGSLTDSDFILVRLK